MREWVTMPLINYGFDWVMSDERSNGAIFGIVFYGRCRLLLVSTKYDRNPKGI